MSTKTLAAALAAARRHAEPATAASRDAQEPGAEVASSDPNPPAKAPRRTPHVDALMEAVRRSARNGDDIVTRRMLLQSGYDRPWRDG